mmetsp:Transcript_17607/g.57096  ORF Transcript_17607/g.57096 Transcript_17607/m.57096 type:complete len:204 (-) Transcript_17607:2404-3015(-)
MSLRSLIISKDFVGARTRRIHTTHPIPGALRQNGIATSKHSRRSKRCTLNSKTTSPSSSSWTRISMSFWNRTMTKTMTSNAPPYAGRQGFLSSPRRITKSTPCLAAFGGTKFRTLPDSESTRQLTWPCSRKKLASSWRPTLRREPMCRWSPRQPNSPLRCSTVSASIQKRRSSPSLRSTAVGSAVGIYSSAPAVFLTAWSFFR